MNWIHNKRLQSNNNCNYPDFLLDLGHQTIIIEVDEYQHNSYDEEDDDERLNQIMEDINKPLIFIRFNPDNYVKVNGEKIRSCFSITRETGLCKIANKKEWNSRLNGLKNGLIIIVMIHIYNLIK